MTFCRRPVLAAAAIAASLAIAACGSSGKPNRSASEGQGIKFAACMRSHGLTNFPDPSGGGGGIQIQSGSGLNPASPAFQAAQNACQKLMPGGGPSSKPAATKQRAAAMLHLSQCMRAHGVSGFPDPVSSPPANLSGSTMAFGSPGAFLVIPDTINTQSPTFKQAAQACQFPGARGGGKPKTI